MSFLSRLFGGGNKTKPETKPLPTGLGQTDEQQDAARRMMEADVAADRKRRDEASSTD